MLCLSQLTPVAYLGDGFIVCLACGDARKLPVKDQLIAYNLESEFEDGCYCDDCGKELVEPYVEDEPEEDEDETAHVLSGVCKDCNAGTLNNELNPAFHEDGTCIRCGSSHVDLA